MILETDQIKQKRLRKFVELLANTRRVIFETNQIDESVAILFRLLAKACNVILETDQTEKTDN